jgi:hypothetical protein
MEDINSIIERLDKGWDVKEARRAVADLIVEYMQSAQGSFGYWEKFHFANAISALAWNKGDATLISAGDEHSMDHFRLDQ